MHINSSDAFINWNAVSYFDPTSIDPFATHGIPLPVYGNYGGPNYSAGTIGGTTPPTPNPAPVDALDTLFYGHDLAYQNYFDAHNGSIDPTATELVAADVGLIRDMFSLLTTEQDPAAVFYDAFATLGYVGKLGTIDGGLAQLGNDLPAIVGTAVHNFEAGLAELPGAETRSLHGAFAVFEHQYLDALFV